jgi:rare lipoprotein A
MYAMTAAHKTLPLPTYVKVTNLRNGKAVIVRVNDRGPFHENRIIDLSYTAAAKLDIIGTGTGLVEVRAINPTTYMIAKKGNNKRIAKIPAGLKAGTVDDFFIQVGSFASLLNARRLKSKLGSLVKDLIRIHAAVLDGKTMYRVQIGPINKIDTADAIVSALARYGIRDHHIVIE